MKQNPYKTAKIIFITITAIGSLLIAGYGAFICVISSAHKQDYSMVLLASIGGLIIWPTLNYLAFQGMRSKHKFLISIYWIYLIVLSLQIPIGTILGYLIFKTKKNSEKKHKRLTRNWS